MFDALILGTVNALEFHETRRNVIRIPEVSSRIREAQSIWDQVSEKNLEFSNFIASDDETFLSHLRMKNLATAIIQLGLLDRFLRFEKMPRLVAGLVNGDSPLRVLSGQQTLNDLVSLSSATAKTTAKVTTLGPLPILAGISLAEFGYGRITDGVFTPVVPKELDFRQVLKLLAAEPQVKKVAVIGPGHGHVQTILKEVAPRPLEVWDTISLEPSLAWFWHQQPTAPYLKEVSV